MNEVNREHIGRGDSWMLGKSMADKYQAGVAAQHLVRFDIHMQNHKTATPDEEFNPYDLIAIVSGQLYKVQVKSSRSDGERLKVDIRKPSAKERSYSYGDYDILAIVDITTRKVAYINKSEINVSRQITLFMTEKFSRAGLSHSFVGMMFDDYLDISRAVETDMYRTKEAV